MQPIGNAPDSLLLTFNYSTGSWVGKENDAACHKRSAQTHHTAAFVNRRKLSGASKPNAAHKAAL